MSDLDLKDKYWFVKACICPARRTAKHFIRYDHLKPIHILFMAIVTHNNQSPLMAGTSSKNCKSTVYYNTCEIMAG